MTKLLSKSAQVVNEGTIKNTDILIEGEIISEADHSISVDKANVKVIDVEGLSLLPDPIDGQAHFKEPGL